MDDIEDFSDDGFDDIDDAEFLAVADNIEKNGTQKPTTPLPQQKTNTNPPPAATQDFSQLLNGAFNSDDIAEDEFEITGVNTVEKPKRMLPASFTRGPAPEGMKQRTLWDGYVAEPTEPVSSSQRATLTNKNEPPTHHRLDLEAAKTWIYPTNVGHRDYQFNIVKKSLFTNVLAALPTGLGKTFIAAVVMLNWYRWAPDAQIVFMAPTKPLVNQQITACYELAGIPMSQSAVMTGANQRKQRAELWEDRRVFFVTPQTLENDLKYGICDPKRIVLLVIDEAHRATGGYAYVNVVNFIRNVNQSFRVLALTATPGSKVETIQDIIDSLGIAKVEIRSEESLDIQQYMNRKHVDTIVLDPSTEMKELKELFCKCVQPTLTELNAAKACYYVNAEKITAFGMTKARTDYMSSPAGRNASWGLKGAINAKFTMLAKLAHPLTMLEFHGINVFYKTLKAVVDEEAEKKEGKTRKAIMGSANFRQLLRKAEEYAHDPNVLSHPKIEYLCDTILRHLMDAEDKKEQTRVMIFSSFRDSAEDIVSTLKKHEPIVKPHIFVGQADSKGGTQGMTQAEQIRTIADFKAGKFNTLVATSIGEEGLDIGEVDLIICYDSSQSPIRMLQRMGRTGRKRDGNIFLLLSRGKEEEAYKKSIDNYQYIQKVISTGEKFTFRHDMSPRILPKTMTPELDKRLIEIPKDDMQPVGRPGGKKRLKKLPPKKFQMPDGVESGFVKASNLGKKQTKLQGFQKLEISEDEEKEEDEEEDLDALDARIAELPMDANSYLLTQADEEYLHKNFGKLHGATTDVTPHMPSLSDVASANRTLQPTGLIRHGRASILASNLFNKINEIENDEFFSDHYDFAYDPSFLETLSQPAFVAEPGSPKPQTSTPKSDVTIRPNSLKRSVPSSFQRPTISKKVRGSPDETPKSRTSLSPILPPSTTRSTPDFVDLTSSQELGILPDADDRASKSKDKEPKGNSLVEILRSVKCKNLLSDDDGDLPEFDEIMNQSTSAKKKTKNADEPKENKKPATARKKVVKKPSPPAKGKEKVKSSNKRKVVVDSDGEDDDEL